MAKICRKCGDSFPLKVWIDGKKKNLQRRHYCLSCSPFGSKNTKRLEESKKEHGPKFCSVCGREFSRKGTKCCNCVFNNRIERIRNKVIDIVGDRCLVCGYNRACRNICFHHVDAEDKLFNLSMREVTGLAWKRVIKEIRKCIPLCMNCHGEVHGGLISEEEIEKLHLEFLAKTVW